MIRNLCLFTLAALAAQNAFAQFDVPTLDQPFVSPGGALVEDFENGTANFGRFDDEGTEDLDDGGVFTAPGGVDGTQQLQTVAPLSSLSQGVLWRGEAVLGSSLLAFTGDWLAAGVDSLSATVQHGAPIDLQFSFRLATRNQAFDSDNFPSVIAGGFAPVTPLALTELSVPVDPTFFFPEAPGFGGFNDVLSDITNIQILAALPSGFEAVSQDLINVAAFDDNITLPDGLGLGDVVDSFTILEDVPIVDENNQPVLIPFGPNAGQQVVQDLVLPNPGAVAVFNTGINITFGLDNVTITAVPEPTAIPLFAVAGFVGMLGRRRGR